MIENQRLVKISDLVENQIPEFIADENPNFTEFLKSYYSSLEYQGAAVDLAENLASYKNFSAFDKKNLVESTTLTSDVDFLDQEIQVTSTLGWPNSYGLLRINNEIITYTSKTNTSFVGCIRGFSGTKSLKSENNEFITFDSTESDDHVEGDVVHNLSNLFLIEFFKGQKTLYTPGLEEVDFDANINPQNFLSRAKTFYQSKGTDEAYKILFKVLYGEDVTVVKPREYCFTPSDDKWIVTETFICDLISGDPFKLEGQTLYQDPDPYNSNVFTATGSIYAVDSFILNSITYYKIRIFSGYSNNLNPKGSISGTFLPTFSTYCVEDVTSGSDSIFVDSTVGFPKSGVLYIGENTYTYTDKTNNQFLNVSTENESLITFDIARGSKIYATNSVYSYENGNEDFRVELRINNVVSKITSEETLYSLKDDPIKIENIGYSDANNFTNSLKYNLPITISAGKAVEEITDGIRSAVGEGFGVSNGLVLTKYPHKLRNDDLVDLYVEELGNFNLYLSGIQVVAGLSNEFSIQKIDDPDILGKRILFRRRLKKTKAVPFTRLFNEINNQYTANVQDAYADDNNNYITSNGLPDYEVNPYIRRFEFSASETNDSSLIGSHNFYDGEAVKVVGYAVSGNFTNSVGFNTGDTYYVKRVGPAKIRLSETRENIGITSISLIELNVNNNIDGKLEEIDLVSAPLYGNIFSTSKIFKKLPKTPTFEASRVKTSPGPVGIFANGVEIQSYKSFDKIYYGKLEYVDVLSGGEGYSLINPPRFKIFNNETDVDNQTFIVPEMEGSLTGLTILNPGYDYESTPTVTVKGGNRKDVATQVKMKYIDKVYRFNATTRGTVVRTTDDRFDFGSTIHPFIDGEAVVYETLNTFPIGIGTQVEDGTLLDQGVYYISDVGAATSFRIAPTRVDAINQTNLINLRTTGGGLQRFRSLEQVQVIDDVTFVGVQSGFSYKKLSFGPDNINIFDNIFYFPNHQYASGEEVVITAEGTYLGGATEGQIYFVDRLDANSFRLCTDSTLNNILNIVSTDFATTYFVQYPPIEVTVDGKLRQTKSALTGYGATIVPVVDGYVKSAHVQRGLSKPALTLLGSKDTINLHKRPKVLVEQGIDAEFQAVVDGGSVTDVIVKNAGEDYFNDFDFVVEGQGYGCRLSATVSNGEIYNGKVSYGQIIDVKVLSGGIGYASTDTTIRIENKGNGLKVQGNLTNYTLNEVEKLGVSNVAKGCLFGTKYSKFGNTYGAFYLDPDLITTFGIKAGTHSPIVGWAYDGSPIYGPYAYTNTDGSGSIIRMTSGYTKSKVSPTTNLDCIEDYQFTNTGTLDENNGRFAVTPEFPRGIYAYYCTIDENNVPVFPYVIGDTYNYIPDESNFDLDHNQDLNFNDLGIIKYTNSYRVEDKDNYYEYFDLSVNSQKPDAVVSSTTIGRIDKVKVTDPGLDYEVGDRIIFDEEKFGNPGAVAEVTSISGVGVTNVTVGVTTFTNVTFITNEAGLVGIATTAHNFSSLTYVNITGISTTDLTDIEGFRKISVEPKSTTLLEALNAQSVTGLVTSIRVKEPVLSFRVDDELKIENETFKVLTLDRLNGRLNVLRQSGTPGYSVGSTVTQVQTTFAFENPLNFKTSIKDQDSSYYFKPSESVSVGISTVAGVGNELTVYPYGIGVSQTKYVEHGGIFLPFNNFKDGEKVQYITDGSSIVSNAGNLDSLPNLYVVKLSPDIIGLVQSKNQIKDRNALLRYNAVGTGDFHKFVTQRPNVVTGTVTQVNVNVATASSHGLSVGNNISLDIVSGVTTTYVVGYSTVTKRVLIGGTVNPKIRTYKNEIVKFDLTDPSIVGKDFNLYSDAFYRNPYFGNDVSGIEVIKTSEELKLTITDNTPSLLYYNLTNITTSDDIFPDFTVQGNNQVSLERSLFETQGKIIGVTSTGFDYNLSVYPERLEYSNSDSKINYSVTDKGILGPINNIKVLYPGESYQSVPSVSKIVTTSGKGADLYATTEEIGKIKNIQILNTESVYPSDKTLAPVSNSVVALRMKDGYFVDSVDILNQGKNYTYAPTLKLYNSVTDSIDSNFKATVVQTGNTITDVVVVNPSQRLTTTSDQIVSTNNSNGIRVLNATSSGSFPYEVELTLETPVSGFSTSNPLPIEVGDKIFVENITSTSGKGFNSSDYGYSTFTVTFVNPNFSAPDLAKVRYELPEYPGVFSSSTFNAIVVKDDDLAKFKPNLVRGNYNNNEVLSPAGVQIIDNESNEPISDIVKIHNEKDIVVGDILNGTSSNNSSEVFEISKFKAAFNLGSSVSENIGWKDFRGNLSTILQKLQDSNYYQNFSYSLRSRKSIDEWKSIISDVSHVSGYKQFGDLSVESEVTSGYGLTVTSDSTSAISISLVNESDVTSIANFDLVIEEDIDDSEGVYSEFLKFGTKKLSDFFESRQNRVLSIDDISTLFDTDTSPFVLIPIDTVDTTDNVILKYYFFIGSTTSFFGDFEKPQVFDLFLSRAGDKINITSYAYFYELYSGSGQVNRPLGEVEAVVDPTNSDNIIVQFKPRNIFNSYAVSAIRETAPVLPGISSTSYGYIDSIEKTAEYPALGSLTTEVLYSYPLADVESGVGIIGISSALRTVENAYEFSFVKTPSNEIVFNIYSEVKSKELGTFGISTTGSGELQFTYDNVVGLGVTVFTNLQLVKGTPETNYNVVNELSVITSENFDYTGAAAVGITTVSQAFSASKIIIQATKTVGVTVEKSLFQVNAVHFGDFNNTTTYGFAGDMDIDEFSIDNVYDAGLGTYILTLTPKVSADYNFKIVKKTILSPNI